MSDLDLKNSQNKDSLGLLLKISYDLIQSWPCEQKKKCVIDQLKSYLSALTEKDSFFYAKNLEKKISYSTSLEEFKIFLIPFERELKSLLFKDKFTVSHSDNFVPNEKKTPLCFILDNIRSAHNVGAMIRVAECVGAEKVYLTGYTADVSHPKVVKASMGSEAFVKVFHQKEALFLLNDLKKEGFSILGLETEKGAKDLFSFQVKAEKIAVIVGNERHGVSLDLLAACDDLIKIPVWGSKNSLNVSSALSVAAYELKRKQLSFQPN